MCFPGATRFIVSNTWTASVNHLIRLLCIWTSSFPHYSVEILIFVIQTHNVCRVAKPVPPKVMVFHMASRWRNPVMSSGEPRFELTRSQGQLTRSKVNSRWAYRSRTSLPEIRAAGVRAYRAATCNKVIYVNGSVRVTQSNLGGVDPDCSDLS